MKKAKWIWIGKESADEYGVFRANLHIRCAQEVRMQVSVFGNYALYVNGTLASFGQYADYIDYKIYDELNLTPFVRVGDNEIKLLCWYVGQSSSVYKEAGAGVIFEAYEGDTLLAYSDENTQCALSASYVSHRKKMITAQLGFSYTYDTRGENQEGWHAATPVVGAKQLFPRPNKKTGLGEFVKGELIDGEKKLYDLGKERSGLLSIRFQAAEGARVQVAFGEHIEDGGVRHYIDGRDFTVDLIGNGAQVEFLGPFLRLGCRYLQILGDAEIVEIGVRETAYPLQVKPYKIADNRRKQIYETSLRTLELCMHEHYEDCPWREQAMYIADSRNQMRCGYYAFENLEFAKSALFLMSKGQKENGLFDLCFPCECPITIPSFSLTFPAALYEYAAYARETSLVCDLLPAVEKMMAYFIARLEENGLFRTTSEEGLWHFYEWAGDLDNALLNPDWSKIERDEFDVLINAYISLACQYCGKLYALVGDFSKQYEYFGRSNALNQAIRKVFFVEEKGLFKTRAHNETYSALANALCILCEACSKEEGEKIAEKLALGCDFWVNTTLSMNLQRFDALLKVNKQKYAEVILKEIDGVYGYMLDKGATSFWETIVGAADFHLAGSLCHGWSAIPVYYYRVLGVTGDAEPTIDERLALRDAAVRTDYAASVASFIQALSKDGAAKRDRYLYMSEEEKRRAFCAMLGYPLTEGKAWEIDAVKVETVLKTESYEATRYAFTVKGLQFSGILYECVGDETPSAERAFFLALHGGGGSSEIVGDLLVDSANYTHMVKRVLRKGVSVFAPQLLLWNTDVYGSGYDRENLNRRLLQLGGSMTALELKLLSTVTDYWSARFDASRMGIVGLSYGGMYALHFGALDKRMKGTYSSCWFNDRRKHSWHDWTYFNAENTFFDAEVASLVLPRNLYIEVGEKDELFLASDAREEAARLQSYAEKSGCAKALHFKAFDGGHELDKDDALLQQFVRFIIEK